jgi:exodeoxyribonuclease VII large subunit
MSGETQNIHEYTVSEISNALKRQVEENFSYVRVRAEISGLKIPASGHVYLALKDDKAVMDGVMWKGMASRLTFRPEDGLEVICTGKLTTYPARSKYQMVIEHMEPAGAGALMALLEERKKKLAAEGLFAPERKKQIPFIPKVIGVVTSPTGAVIRDILHRLQDRFPRHVIVWPVPVQGTAAAPKIAAAIRGFNAMKAGGETPKPDLLIVARGGGSLEDLWAFNEEEVVRAAAESDIPLISAVGHETDTTLIDYASDLRAPTPTAAAEKAVPVWADLDYTVRDLSNRMDQSSAQTIVRFKDKVQSLFRALPKPRDLLGLASQRVDDLTARLSPTILTKGIEIRSNSLTELNRRLTKGIIDNRDKSSHTLQNLSRLMTSLGHASVLDRGYAILFDKKSGKPILSSKAVSAGDGIVVEVKDGKINATVDDGSGPKKRVIQAIKKKKGTVPVDAKQGQLL